MTDNIVKVVIKNIVRKNPSSPSLVDYNSLIGKSAEIEINKQKNYLILFCNSHAYKTSKILKLNSNDESIIVETLNTIYYFEKIIN